MTPPFIGVITGSVAEAKALAMLKPPRFRIAISAADSARAQSQAGDFIAQGACGLISAGLCGALDPALGCGSVLLVARVIDGAGHEWLAADQSPGVTLLGSDALLATPAEKAAAHRATGAAAVDMESHRVAAMAAQAAVPFLCLRVVADAADTALPAVAARLIDPDGRTRPAALFHALTRAPGETLAMMRSGLVALRALRRAASDLSAQPIFGG